MVCNKKFAIIDYKPDLVFLMLLKPSIDEDNPIVYQI